MISSPARLSLIDIFPPCLSKSLDKDEPLAEDAIVVKVEESFGVLSVRMAAGNMPRGVIDILPSSQCNTLSIDHNEWRATWIGVSF